MNKLNILFGLILAETFLLISQSCKKDEDDNQLTFKDSRDGQIYQTVKIGNQIWMAENLNYNAENGSWAYDNNSSNTTNYGRFYNWETACNACPNGWHLPSYDNWTALENYLVDNGYGYGGSGIDIGKALAATSGWWPTDNPGEIGNNQTSNNSSGFNAFPFGGYDDGNFYDIYLYKLNKSMYAEFWSSTESSITGAWMFYLYSLDDYLNRGQYKKSAAYSIRCVRD